MSRFVVVYHALDTAQEQMENATPEDAQSAMEPWMAWAAKCGDALVDMGTPLANGVKITENAQIPSERNVVGYSMLEAESMEAALAMLEGHPHLGWAEGCEIEVHESLGLPS